MDLNLDRDFFAQFIYGGVDITAFQFLNNRSETYRKWQQIWEQYKDQYPDLFPLKVNFLLIFFQHIIASKLINPVQKVEINWSEFLVFEEMSKWRPDH